ncbi:hypothetical protein HKX48_006584 [Thoreauomyces humboldtii]|nr:hypothetical protein HKX48_006584 [Thoreauomyces humboldtii]
MSSLLRPEVRDYLDMMLACTGFPGHFAADETISELPLTFWMFFQEELQDTPIFNSADSVAPDFHIDPATGKPIFYAEGTSVDSPGGGMVNIAPASRAPDREQTATIAAIAKSIFARLVEILRMKSTFPPEAEWNAWDTDTRDRFTMYRRETSDMILSCAYVLRDEMLAYLIPLAARQLNDFETSAAPWHPLEATVFAVKSMSDAVLTDDLDPLDGIIGPEFLGRLSVTAHLPPRLHITVCLLIGSYGEWMATHPDHLARAARFLTAAVQVPKLSRAAVDALLTLCDLCRSQLVGEVDALVQLWTSVAPTLPPEQKSKLVKAVANVIQQMPYQQSMPRLWVVLDGIILDINRAFDACIQDPVNSREVVTNQLECLKSCCQGVSAPELKIELLDHHDPTGTIAAQSSQALPENTQNQEVTRVIWNTTRRTCDIYGGDAQVMRALCQFIIETLRNTLPIFSADLAPLVSLLVDTYAKHQMPVVLTVATAIACAHGDGSVKKAEEGVKTGLSALLEGIMGVTLQFVDRHDLDDVPDLVQAFFEMLTKVLDTKYATYCPWSLLSLPQATIDALLSRLLLRGLGMSERTAITSILSFLLAFLSTDHDDSALVVLTRYVVARCGADLVRELVAAIGGRQPRSLEEGFVDVLFKMSVRYTELTKCALVGCLAMEGFPSARVEREQKEAFVKNVIGIRQIVRFRGVVKQFSLQCRGLTNTAF